jgi:hypothetical protein
MKRMFGGIVTLVGAAATGWAIYAVLITKGLVNCPYIGTCEPAYFGAAGLALLTFGLLTFQK